MNGTGQRGAFQAFTFRANGRVNRIITPVVVFPPFDPKSGVAPAGVSANALWDTGATSSVIRPEIVSALGLQPTGTVDSHTAGGPTRNPTHVVNIALPNHTLMTGVLVSESANLKGFQAIIGMDVIVTGDFSITNADGKTWMSFRYPSVEHIDYVSEHQQLMRARVGRNDPCPCGKKKADGHPMKFKHCCGR